LIEERIAGRLCNVLHDGSGFANLGSSGNALSGKRMVTMLRTPLTDLLNIGVPIVQAPIGSATCPELAAAVSNADGLGMLALSWKKAESARVAIRKTRALTSKPFAVNLVLEWDQTERLEVCLEENVPVISFSWGDASSYVSLVKEAGSKTMVTVASAADAERMATIGVDVIVAQGWEAGGHVLGQVTTLALVPRVVDAVDPVPVVAAGGVADGRGVAAALALGAAGVWVGTRFLASEESRAHPRYRESLLAAAETDTAYTTAFNGGWSAPHRVIRNSTLENWWRAGSPAAGKRPGEGEVVARCEDGNPIRLYDDAIPCAGMKGEMERLALYAGQSVGLVETIKPAASIVHEMMEQATRVIRGLPR
jgi:NAD(P)H-dependent flavin oxidoreductase YrpB (nitropropane dioxygenase family)